MRAPQRSRLPQYTHCKQDFLLIDALEDWHEMKTTVVHGWTSLRDLGPSLIMTNATLERIVDCAHHRKILSVQDMRRETGWSGADQFGLEIIAIIQKHAAPLPSPFISSPLRPAITTAPDATRSHSTAPSLATNSSPCQLQMPFFPLGAVASVVLVVRRVIIVRFIGPQCQCLDFHCLACNRNCPMHSSNMNSPDKENVSCHSVPSRIICHL